MRKNPLLKKSLGALSALTAAVLLALPGANAHANAGIQIIVVDGPTEGFNDPTPRAPIGGNSGTTVGQQRLIAFTYAAELWGATLDSPETILIRAAFNPLTCTATSAVLGSAGAWNVYANFPNAPLQDVWYHGALGNKYAQTNLWLAEFPGDTLENAADINAQFNSSIGTVPGCLTGSDWYYGLDNNHGTNTDLVTVLLHEFAHGLGFSSFVSRPSGAYLLGAPGIYDLFIHDNTTNTDWVAMTNAQRATSMKNGRNVVWTGDNVTDAVPSVLVQGTPALTITGPALIAGNYAVGAATFGPQLSTTPVAGQLVQATDADEDGAATVATTTDGCSALTNAADVAGKIAVVDRGNCTFNIKAQRVQAAGGIGMVVADNAAGSPPAGLGGVDPTITIPAVRITQVAGIAIKAQLAGGVFGSLGVDLSQRAGADTQDRALLNTPDPVVGGSSVSHWDPIAFKNQLMEPAINGDLTHNVTPPDDLTLPQMRDIGWFPDADIDGVPDGSDQCADTDLSATVVVGDCDSGAPNTLFANGCTVSDEIGNCADAATTHGGFVSCVTHYTTDVRKVTQALNNKERSSIQACAAGAAIP